MAVPRRGVWRSVAGRRRSNSGDPCGRIWPGTSGVIPGLVADGPCGEGAVR